MSQPTRTSRSHSKSEQDLAHTLEDRQTGNDEYAMPNRYKKRTQSGGEYDMPNRYRDRSRSGATDSDAGLDQMRMALGQRRRSSSVREKTDAAGQRRNSSNTRLDDVKESVFAKSEDREENEKDGHILLDAHYTFEDSKLNGAKDVSEVNGGDVSATHDPKFRFPRYAVNVAGLELGG